MEPSDRLDRAIEERRLDLDLSLNDVASAAKISPATLRAIRRGTTQPTPLTKRRLEDALRWAHGSIDTILTGGEPTTYEAEADRQATEFDAGRRDFAEVAADLAAQLAEQKRMAAEQERRTSDLERRLEELLRQQEEERNRRGRAS